MIPTFQSAQDSHFHSLKTLNLLYEHDDFMDSVGTLLDLGCGTGLDLEWWATRTTRDLDRPRPLNIKCMGVDLYESFALAGKYKNIVYQSHDFEQPLSVGKFKYDVLWCHDAFQYVLDPFTTLRHWWEIASENSMLIIIVPQTTNLEFNKQCFEQDNGVFWHWTVVNLMHVLAVTGWDTSAGYFRKEPNDPWIHAVVYRGKQISQDPRKITWYELSERNLLHESAVKSINRCGYLRQQDLVLPWIDRSLQWFGSQ